MSCLKTLGGGIAAGMEKEKTRNQHRVVQILPVSTMGGRILPFQANKNKVSTRSSRKKNTRRGVK